MLMLKEAIAKHEDDLSISDRRLIEVMVHDPGESALLSAAKLGEKAGVHAATVVRLAKKLGFSGFPALQEQLQTALLSQADPARRLQKSLKRIQSGDIIAELVATEQENLAALPDQVTQSQITEAAKMLVNARSIYVFAYGHASALAEIAIRRFRRYGILVTDLRYQGRELAERTLSLCASDAVLCFSFRRIAPGLEQLLDHADKVSAHTLLITDLPFYNGCAKPELVLSAGRGQSTEYQTLSVPMLMLNALVLTMANEPATHAHIEKLGELIDTFEHD